MKTSSALRTGRITASGIPYYYEIHGRGTPLVVLHGGLGSIEMFGPTLPALAAAHEVIAIDLRGHGRTPLGDLRIDLAEIADDVATVVRALGHGRVDALGFSMGAGVAMRLALQHPALVNKLVVASAGYSTDGFYPEMLPQQAGVSAAAAPMMTDFPLYRRYLEIAPNPGDFPRLLDAMGAWLRAPYDWAAEIPRITAHTLLVFGDSDMFRLDHVVEMYRLFGGGQRDAGWQREHQAKNRLAVLPDVTHYEMCDSPQLAAAVLPFLAGK